MKPKHELSPSAKAALAGYRRATTVDPLAKARMWRDISRGVEALPPVEARPALGVGKVLAIVVMSTAAAAALVVWLGQGSVGGPADARAPDAAGYDRIDPEPSVAEPRSNAAIGVQPPAEAAPPVPSEPPPPEPAAARKRSSPSSRPRAVPRSSEPEPDPLATEMQLLGAARARLDRGDHAGALASLAEHERRFPSGQLSQERAALRIEALCISGPREQGRGEAKRFLVQWPDSHHAQKIRRACDVDDG